MFCGHQSFLWNQIGIVDIFISLKFENNCKHLPVASVQCILDKFEFWSKFRGLFPEVYQNINNANLVQFEIKLSGMD